MTRLEDAVIDLGRGHTFAPVTDAEDRLVGWVHTHRDARDPDGVLCQSFCAVRPIDGSPVHSILQADPLSLSPSLKCRTCGVHGHVTNGQWEPC